MTSSNTPPPFDWDVALPFSNSVPLDEDGFVVSFRAPEEHAQVQEFLDKYGFVVIREVLTSEECDASLDEFFNGIAGRDSVRHPPTLVKDDPDTWGPYYDAHRFSHLGIIGMSADFSPAQLRNRTNRKVYDGYRTVLGQDDLIVDHDRIGVMRPTRNVCYKDGTIKEDVPEWRTMDRWLHLDANPLNNKASIAGFRDDGSKIDFDTTLIPQGLVTLTDARVKDGGFHCVPGSHKVIQAFLRSHASQHHISHNNFNVDPDDDSALMDRIQQIPIRRGCLLVWTSLLLHGNHPNQSNNWRAVQYIRMVPRNMTPYHPLVKSAEEAQRCGFPEDVEFDDLGKRLLGWKE